MYAERHGQQEEEERRDVVHGDGGDGGDGGGDYLVSDVSMVELCQRGLLTTCYTLRPALTHSLTAHTDLHSGEAEPPGPLLHLHQSPLTPLVRKPPLARPRPMRGPDTAGGLQVGIDLTVLDLSISVTQTSHY